jgi:hypothetical protein
MIKNSRKARLIAYYLPQFHPIPENDEQWGKGFTEWTNIGKAKPLYKGHYQPFLPTELGYYDLRLPEVRKAQADLAREYGIEGFCYWHYWFGSKRLLETPFNEVVKSGEPDFPFCLCWANHSWTAIWVGDTKKVIIEQTYPGEEDYTKHFYELLPAFKDNRYIKVEGKLLFSIFSPKTITNCKEFVQIWQTLAAKEGIGKFHFVGMGVNESELSDLGLDVFTPHSPHPLIFRLPIKWKDRITYRLFNKSYVEYKASFFKKPRIYDYKDLVEVAEKQKYADTEYPVAIPNWDHTPRGGVKSFVLNNSTPVLFGKMLKHCIAAVSERPFENRIVFLKAWNEWAEGNFLEPEAKYGREYLEAIKEENKE